MKKNLILPMAALVCGCTLALSGCGDSRRTAAADYIGIDAAKEAALTDAGVSAGQADFSSAGLDNRDGVFYYEVNFTENGTEYQYDIDAMTGVVIEKDVSQAVPESSSGAETSDSSEDPSSQAETSAALAGGSAAQAADSSAQAGGSAQSPASAHTGAASSGAISESQAQSIALSHAGLTEDQVAHMKVKKDFHRGQSIFEVEFYSTDGAEYSYDISAEDGAVINYDYDAGGSAAYAQSGSGMLTEDQARAVVLQRVPGASGTDIRLKLDEDDGRMEYEGWLDFDGMEYEFKIDAYSGAVLEWEADSVSNP